MKTTQNYINKYSELLEKRFVPVLLATALLFSLFTVLLMSRPSDAIFTKAFVRLDRMKASTASAGRVCAQPATVGTETHVEVTFPTGMTVSTTLSDWATTDTPLDSGQSAWPGRGSGNATSAVGQTVIWTSGDLTVGTFYCFNFSASGITSTGTAGANKTGTVTSCTSATCTPTTNAVDSSSYAVAVIDEDQITVTATVPPTFSFSIAGCTSGNCTDAFTANLSSAIIGVTTGKTVTISTNANTGWIAWVKDSQQGLRSTIRSYTIATTTAGTACSSGHTLVALTEGYGLDVNVTNGTGPGTPAADANYNCTGDDAGGLSSAFLPAASSGGAGSLDTMTLIAKAAISAITPAATDYQDIITVVGAGNF